MNNPYITFTGIITVLFVTARLLGLIDWSWWLVFSPVIILIGVGFVSLAVFGAVVLTAVIEAKKKEAKRNGQL